MRKISVAFTAATLALSMLAQAIPAAAVTGYDSAYAGESAFVTLAPGQTNEFQVFFANTGVTTWTRGTSTQVDLAACLEDKVTCNAQDASEAPWNTGWLSATRYATTTQTAVAPGSIATFKYTVTAPAGVAAGTYRFNGDLVLSSTGERIHPEGYFQDATVGTTTTGAAATLVAANPVVGDITGGTTVTLSGSNFACTPAFPTVTFGDTAGTVTSCGATSLTVKAPAHAAGTVNLTVTNSGAAASNALLFTFKDLTPPDLKQLTAFGGTPVVNVAFSESVCNNATFAIPADWTVTVNGTNSAVLGVRKTTGTDLTASTTCDAAAGAAAGANASPFTSVDLQISQNLVAGDFVTATITATGFPKIQDTAGNQMTNAETVTGTAMADTTKPSISSVTTLSATSVRANYSEPVICGTGNAAGALADFLNQFTATVGGSTFHPTAATCPANATLGASRITLTFGSDISAGGFITYQESSTSANRVKDLSGNNATSPQTASFSAVPAATPPVITDAHVTVNTGSTNFGDVGDTFTLTFNEAMNTSTTGTQIQVTDTDPGATKDLATFDCSTNVTCTWNTAATTLTVRVTVAVTGAGGATPGLQLPLTITATTGITDADDGVPPNLAASDKIIE